MFNIGKFLGAVCLGLGSAAMAKTPEGITTILSFISVLIGSYLISLD